MTAREELLQKAMQYVSKDRNSSYDEPENNFGRIADILNVMGYQHAERGALKPSDVAQISIAIKVARLAHSPHHEDSWVDLAGYAACGWECTTIEKPLS
jgi:hypothetical protein